MRGIHDDRNPYERVEPISLPCSYVQRPSSAVRSNYIPVVGLSALSAWGHLKRIGLGFPGAGGEAIAIPVPNRIP